MEIMIAIGHGEKDTELTPAEFDQFIMKPLDEFFEKHNPLAALAVGRNYLYKLREYCNALIDDQYDRIQRLKKGLS